MRFVFTMLMLCASISALAQDFSKAEKERLKKEEKERLRRPAQIVIQAPAAQLKAIVVSELVKDNWQLVQEGDYRLTFQRDPQGFWVGLGSLIAFGGTASNPPRFQVGITITELPSGSLVIADLSVVVQRIFGTQSRYNFNKDKKARPQADAMLARLKVAAETGQPFNQAEAMAAKPVTVSAPVTVAPQSEAPQIAPVAAPAPRRCYDNGRKVPCPPL